MINVPGGSGIRLRKPLAKYRRAKRAYSHPPPTRGVVISPWGPHIFTTDIRLSKQQHTDDTYINAEKNTHESSVCYPIANHHGFTNNIGFRSELLPRLHIMSDAFY